MTARPTRADVERALSFVHDTEYEGEPGHDYYGTLAAEVLALRELLTRVESVLVHPLKIYRAAQGAPPFVYVHDMRDALRGKP